MSDHEEDRKMQFVPFSSAIDSGFWYKLYQKKLDEYKLEDASVNICAYYSNGQSNGLPPIANIDYTAFDGINIHPDTFPLKGILLNTNTLEEFKTNDKKLLLQTFGEKLWKSMLNGEAIKDPSLLQQILCFTFTDLIKYHYYYWVAFPAFLYPEVVCHHVRSINEYFNENQIDQLLRDYDSFSEIDRMYFVIHVQDDGNISILKLSTYDSSNIDSGKIILGFSDPSTVETTAGWPLRNFFSLVSLRWCKNSFLWDVVCLRDRIKDNSRICSHSIVLSVEIKDKIYPEVCPKTVGWEKYQNKLLPRKVDMDPFKLANSAFDLNLKLMRWRALPELELDFLSSTKCLLLGAGALGCSVARSLLGWGVRNITIVDNARVSFSNPVRQTLFQFEDCLNGGRPKAEAACDALKKIFPGVNAVGKMLSIPMPGHFVSRSDCVSVQTDVQELENLINYHDVVFLLMDTNESRWLPTVISAAKQKIVLNSALGFETFRVMRHAFSATEPSSVFPPELLQQTDFLKIIGGQELGCFFCYNIFAPGDSTRYHTLDQQCTATRPGVSSIAAALVVELMVSILHHPQRGVAPAAAEIKNKEYVNDTAKYSKGKEYRRIIEEISCIKSPLGIIPHIMDGHLNSFHIDINVTRADDCCTACSKKVIDAYKQDGFNFLLKVFNNYRYLEELSGLSDRYINVDLDDVSIGWSDVFKFTVLKKGFRNTCLS